jgi:serine protease 16
MVDDATGQVLTTESLKGLPSKEGLFFTQRVDHFDRLSTATFEQRYFVNETFWAGADTGAPVFMCVGGEGPPLDAGVVQIGGSVHCDDMMVLAQKLGALTVALEHRFYGPSTPDGGWSTDNLRFSNSEQALEDVASFIGLIQDMYQLHPSSAPAGGSKILNKWVTWGGSYPGMMAAMSRLRFPHLVHASVSSSSPLEASLEMPGYNQVVGESISNPDVGGSQQCFDTVRNGHAVIKAQLASEEGRRALEDTFNICDPLSLEKEENREQFAGDGVVMLPAQGNDPACTGSLCNIEGVCGFLASLPEHKSDVDKLAALSARQKFGQCVPVSYEAELQMYAKENNPMRAWLWQTCTEYGFYMTCPDDDAWGCPYARGLHRVDTDLEICSVAFGLTPQQVTSWVGATNGLYGGANIQATRIMYPNGEIDPWRALGVVDAPNADAPTLMVKTSSHHYWTHPALDTDNAYIKDARVAIWDQVTAWLQE